MIFVYRLFVSASLIVASLLLGCSSHPEESSTKAPASETSAKNSAIDRRIAELQDDLRVVRTRAGDLYSDAQESFEARAQQIQRQLDIASQRAEALAANRGEEWSEVKQQLNLALDNLQGEISQLKSDWFPSGS